MSTITTLASARRAAKSLLKALRAGDPHALARLGALHPRFRDRAAGADADLRLHHAQLVVAREAGFPSWPRLKAWADWREGRAVRLLPFRREPGYYADRAFGLKAMVNGGDPRAAEQVRLFHPGFAAADAEIGEISEDDARLVVARQHGFDTWPAFEGHLAAMPATPSADREPFRAAYAAIEAVDLAALRALVAAHPDVLTAAGTNGNTLLNLASASLVTTDLTKSPGERNDEPVARLALVESLLDAGAEPDAANLKGWTPLHQAAYANNGDLAQCLIAAGATVDLEAYADGGTPLTVALWWGHREVTRYLAEFGVIPGNLRVAAGLGRLDLMADLFTSDGRPTRGAGLARGYHRPHSGFPEWRPTPGHSQEILDDALSFAVRNGQVPAMAFLVARGADVNSVPCNGSPLQWAAVCGRHEAARWLLVHGADPNRKAPFARDVGNTPLHRAAFSDDPAMIDILVDAGADPGLSDETYQSTPLGWANHLGKDAARDHLVRRHAARFPLHDLCEAGADPSVVAARLDAAPALVEGENGAGMPLRAAAHAGRHEIVILLLDRGADPGKRSRDGMTAADLAAEAGHEQIARILRLRMEPRV